ncbi:hypothetical protein G7092_20485 [Mucilaginibacter sp. HC2]|uniref:hypothetical protein n=1 Tax=Mucilaginibacter inviolabilis TaxID=2714892 RepID=UPI001408CBDE|nr:hypothetical protein [Mucilaginibacter inviolabilis]NHA06198.1 hypothetical protein [Mucilaginibacter inviolabilis]
MKITVNKPSIIRAIIITVFFVVLISCYEYIHRYISGALLSLFIFGVLITIVVFLIKEIITIVKKRKSLSFSYFLPVLIYILVPFGGSFIDLKKLESRIVLRGCYEGTQNQAYIVFREDHTFELNWTGVFFYDKWYTGRWNKKNDTIDMKYDGEIVPQLGDKVIINQGFFKPVGKQADTVRYPRPMFYVGFCKGNN